MGWSSSDCVVFVLLHIPITHFGQLASLLAQFSHQWRNCTDAHNRVQLWLDALEKNKNKIKNKRFKWLKMSTIWKK